MYHASRESLFVRDAAFKQRVPTMAMGNVDGPVSRSKPYESSMFGGCPKRGAGEAAAIAASVAQTAQAVAPATEAVNKAMQTTQQGNREKGVLTKARTMRQQKSYAQLKKKMSKGKFPKMSEDELWAYVEEQFA
jgi:hypothetical protein